jgi:ferrous iron transport protein A
MTVGTIPLTQAPLGAPLKLVRIRGGKHMVHRLADMGLTRGVEITILQDSGGPLLISVRDTRIALGRGMARHLVVTPCEDNGHAEAGRRERRFGRRHRRHGLRWGRARHFDADSPSDSEQDA